MTYSIKFPTIFSFSRLNGGIYPIFNLLLITLKGIMHILFYFGKTTKRNQQLIKNCSLLFKNLSYESTSLSSDKDIDRKDKNQHCSIHSSGLPEEPKGSNNKSDNKNSKLEDPTKGSDGEPTTNPKGADHLKIACFPHPPVKIYDNAGESRLDLSRDFKNKAIIYM